MRATGSRTRLARLAVAAALAVAVVGAAAVAGVAGTSASGGAPAPAAFRLADGSAACVFDRAGGIACRRAGAPKALVLEPDGTVREDGRAVGWTAATPVLLPGESWWNGGVSCVAGEGTVVCSGRSGDSLALR